MPDKSSTRDQIARLVRKCLEEGQSVDIDGLGVFRSDGAGGYQFIAQAGGNRTGPVGIGTGAGVDLQDVHAGLRVKGFVDGMNSIGDARATEVVNMDC